MSFHNDYDFSLLVNEKERWVIDELERQLTLRPEVCNCEECVLDMVALALNNSKPTYRVTLMGSIYAKAEDDENHLEIVKAVTSAIDKISVNPSHSRSSQ